MYTFCLKLKMVNMYEDVKVICNVICIALLNKMLLVDLGVRKMFCSSTMLEFDCDDGICF